MGIAHTLSVVLTAASDNCISVSQTPGAAGNLTITGTAATAGVATLDTQRRVLLTFAASEVGHTFVVYGTKQGGTSISETVAGTGIGTVATNQDFLTVTRVSISAAATGAINVGTNGVGSTDWQSIDTMRQPVNVAFQAVVGAGTVNYSIQTTVQDVNMLPSGTTYPTAFDSVVAAQATNQVGSITDPVSFFRLVINSGTDPVTFTYQQAGP
jgi:hypothetical protein